MPRAKDVHTHNHCCLPHILHIHQLHQLHQHRPVVPVRVTRKSEDGTEVNGAKERVHHGWSHARAALSEHRGYARMLTLIAANLSRAISYR